MPPTKKDRRVLSRPSSAFERPADNVYVVPDDGGSPLGDVSTRPAALADVDITDPTDE